MTEGRLHESIRIGEDFLRRTPSDAMLRNNVSFAKVLLGDLSGAERLLIPSDALPLTFCTQALIALARGRARETSVAAEAVSADSNADCFHRTCYDNHRHARPFGDSLTV